MLRGPMANASEMHTMMSTRDWSARIQHKMILTCCAGLLALAVGLTANAAQAAVTLTHVHGLAYSPDGKQIYVPSHHGLAVYADGRWSKASGPEHDYMGFSATKDAMYSSGHPAPGSGLVNPFGVIRSTDAGKTWDKLGMEGETDFHLLATSYETNAIYVFNPAPNSRMKAPGLYHTVNAGFSWKRSRAEGFPGDPVALAVHPSDPEVVAIAAKSGLYLSTDSGDRFRAVITGKQTLTVFFDLDGVHLWASTYAGAPMLVRMDIKKRDSMNVSLPPLTRDAVAYIAQNPVKNGEYAVATFERSIYLTPDAGRTWKQIARNGNGQ